MVRGSFVSRDMIVLTPCLDHILGEHTHTHTHTHIHTHARTHTNKVVDGCADGLFVSSFNRIDLPPYKSYHKLKNNLKTAVENTEGFEGVD